MPVKRAGLPLWATVLADLRSRLSSGEFVDRFPSDRELVDHYGVSRHTVREAVRRLDAVERRPRVGGRVRSSSSVLQSLLVTLSALGVLTSTTAVSVRRGRAAGVATELGLDVDTVFTICTDAMHADGDPLIVSQIWCTTMDFDVRSLSSGLLRPSGPELAGIRFLEQRTMPRVAEPAVCRALRIPPNSAIFCIETRLEIADHGEAIHRAHVRADRYPCIVQFTPI